MQIIELTEVLNSADLLPYEVARAVIEHLKPMMETEYGYCDLEQLMKYPQLLGFYTSAKLLAD